MPVRKSLTTFCKSRLQRLQFRSQKTASASSQLRLLSLSPARYTPENRDPKHPFPVSLTRIESVLVESQNVPFRFRPRSPRKKGQQGFPGKFPRLIDRIAHTPRLHFFPGSFGEPPSEPQPPPFRDSHALSPARHLSEQGECDVVWPCRGGWPPIPPTRGREACASFAPAVSGL